MPSLVPTAEDLRILQARYGSGTYYAHLCTVEPTASASTVADLVVATGGNYAAETLTSVSVAANGTGAIVDCADLDFGNLTTNGTPIVSVAFIKQVGGSPASSDQVIAAQRLEDGSGNASPYTPNGAPFVYEIPTLGILKID